MSFGPAHYEIWRQCDPVRNIGHLRHHRQLSFGGLDMTPLATRIAILAPRYSEPRTGVTSTFSGHDQEKGKPITTIEVAMTSVNSVRCSAFEVADMFWEELFAGYVDYEFCLRCRHHGLLIVGVEARSWFIGRAIVSSDVSCG